MGTTVWGSHGTVLEDKWEVVHPLCHLPGSFKAGFVTTSGTGLMELKPGTVTIVFQVHSWVEGAWVVPDLVPLVQPDCLK